MKDLRVVYKAALVIIPLIVGATAYCCGFNGLYGQDSHEYLRQSVVIFNRLQGSALPAPTLGDAVFPGGFPLLGALLRFLLRNAVLSLAAVSWLATGISLLLFDYNLQKLSPGSAIKSRIFYTLLLALAPVFFTSGLVCMTDMTALMVVLAMLLMGLNVIEANYGAPAAAVLGAFALQIRFAMAGLVLPMAVIVTWHLFRKRKYISWIYALIAGVAVLSMHFWLKSNTAAIPVHHEFVEGWSFNNLFSRTFFQVNGHLSYWLPNGLFVLSVLMHPGYCLFLPGLFFLVRKTDTHLPYKKILLLCLACYLLLIGGIPNQNHRFLLPAYAIILLLLFPAFDRFISYGFTFFKTYTRLALILTFGLQSCICVKWLYPVIQRNRQEQVMAAGVSKYIQPHQVLYGFDWDIALHTYLPEITQRNLWMERYTIFEPGAFVLFNAPVLQKQWSGKNPMLNWEALNTAHTLQPLDTFQNGWVLYQILD